MLRSAINNSAEFLRLNAVSGRFATWDPAGAGVTLITKNNAEYDFACLIIRTAH